MSTKYPQGLITPTPPFKSTTAKSFSGVWTLEQLAKNFYYYTQPVSNSLRFRSSASAYLNRTPSTGGNQQTWTWSGWVKKGNLTVFEHLFGAASSVSNRFSFNFDNSVASGTNGDYLCAFIVLGGTTTNLFQTNALFRDPSAWYHVVLAVDTTQATSTNRLKLYVNGIQQTFSTYNAPAQNTNLLVNSAIAHNIASGAFNAGTYCFDGYLAEINFIDGQALDPSYFGQVSPITGVWSPAPYVGSYGTNGFHLNFSNGTSTTTLGYDSSGNGNNWTTNNISLTSGATYDWMIDSPTPYQGTSYGVGNYCVISPLSGTSGSAVTNGNLTVTGSSSSGDSRYGSFGVSSGKWYWEHTVTNVGTSGVLAGISSDNNQTTALTGVLGYYINGNKYNGSTPSAYGASFTTGDVIGVAFDADAGTLTFYKNNASQGVAFTGITGTYYPLSRGSNSGTATVSDHNFGQRPFAYTPPSGFKSLCTYNLPTPTIQNGANYMAATLYTGNGSTQSIINAVNGISFQPDWVWVKNRSAANSHNLADVIRGATNGLASNSTTAAYTQNGFASFNSNGFGLAADTSQQVNTSAATYVGWQWKAGGTAVTNTAGSITSQVSANTTAGFSVVTYTGTGASAATIGHGLGVAPNFVFLKQRNGSTYGWIAYHSALGAGSYLVLNQTFAGTADTAMFNNTAPTSSVFTLSSGGDIVITNPSGGTMVAYCFAAIAGYSAFGSYTGNGSADGPFVYCGFRPRYVLIKCSSTTDQWIVHDTARDPYNASNYILIPNLADGGYTYDATNTSYPFDILSNGFKLRNAYPNASGATYIYAAFAENPFNYSLAR